MLDIATWHQEAERSPRAVYLEAGVPISNELGMMAEGETPLVPRAGQRVVLFPNVNRVRARALRSSVVTGALDGAAVPVSATRNFQEVGVAFSSAATSG